MHLFAKKRHVVCRVRYQVVALVLALAVISSGCKQNVQAASVAKAQGSATAPTVVAPQPSLSQPVDALQPTLRALIATKDLPYARLRKALVDSGWLPLRDPMCRENVGGRAEVCYKMQEVESCSGDGYCSMNFANEELGLTMRVSTYGDYRHWDQAGEESELLINSTHVDRVSSLTSDKSSSSIACPSRDFDTFLKAFASDEAIQHAFTAPLVKVAEQYSDDFSDHHRAVYVLRDHYKKFSLNYSSGAFYFVDSTGKADRKPVNIDIKTLNGSSRLVRYMKDVSEGNSYLFEKISGCLALTEDPERPSP
jgi:hypothetical protein